MSVASEVTSQLLEEEIEAMVPLIATYGWHITKVPETLTVTVQMKSVIDGEVYIVEACCDDYKECPPFFEFIHLESGERGTRRCYPNGSTYFHDHPCICVEWNRKAYVDGPHREWDLSTWQRQRPGMTFLGDMFHLIQIEINKQDQYKGRKL